MFFVPSLTGMQFTPEQFRDRFPDDAACLHAMMLRGFGGTQFACPAAA